MHNEHITKKRLLAAYKRGDITLRRHPKHRNLVLAKYTHKYAYSKKTACDWDMLTLACRGLVFDMEGEGRVLARPFDKFFNYFEHSELSQYQFMPQLFTLDNYRVYEKMDGSFIIAFWYKDELIMTTTGAWDSEQAQEAHKIYFEQYGDFTRIANPNYTYMFEVLYPENRIVVDYGSLRSMVFLGARRNTGYNEVVSDTFNHSDLPRTYDDFTYSGLINDMATGSALPDSVKEGFVVRFETGLMVKFKYETYFALHRLRSQMSPTHILQSYRDGTLNTMEWLGKDQEYAEEVIRKAKDMFAETFLKMTETYDYVMDMDTRKEQAIYINERPEADLPKSLRGVIFSLLDDNVDRANEMIWKYVGEHL